METKTKLDQGFIDEAAMKANVKYKDSVFTMLFRNPDLLRELYSAIEGVELPPDTPISINTLNNVLVRGKLNDISFAVDNRLVILIEHQSTINCNMPYRLLDYIVRVLRTMVDWKKILQRTPVKIPKPEFIVLYNGQEKLDDYKEIKLSDSFMDVEDLADSKNQKSSLELVVRVFNINHGHNTHMLKRSTALNDYSIFMDKINECKKSGLDLAESVKSAVKYCIDNNILNDFLRKYAVEVINMMLEEITLEDEMEAYKEKGREEGREQEREYFISLLDQGLSNEEIKQRLKK